MIEQLKQLLGEENISHAQAHRQGYAISGQLPELVLFPCNNEQISTVLKLANRAHKKVVVCGNNSQRYFGAAIEPFDWCIALNRMTQIIEHAAADLTVTVEAGIQLSQLQSFLHQQRQFLPIDPFDASLRTVGGIVATNSTGPLRLHYGAIRDLVLGMTIILADGTVIRAGGKTVKNVAGYDLSKMFVGSMGTLGVITSITFRLSPLPAYSQTLWAEFDRFDAIANLLRQLAASNLVIGRCEFLNAPFFENFELNSIHFQTPQGLLINVHGPLEMVSATMTRLQQLAHSSEGKNFQTWQGIEEAELWDQIARRSSTNGKNKLTSHFQIAIPKSSTIPIIEAIQRFGSEQGMNFAIDAHVGNGIIHIFSDEQNGSRLRSQIESLRQMALSYQGNLIVISLMNQSDFPSGLEPDLIWGAPRPDFRLMQQIKAKYDLAGIFAAGRFIGGL